MTSNPGRPPASQGLKTSLRVKELEEELRSTQTSIVCAFSQVLDLRDLTTGCHSTRLAEWAVRVGREFGIEEKELQDIEIAALLHDIGKVGIGDAVLRKPGPLTEEERTLMQKHPEYGWAILRSIPGLERAALLILHHHESYDGAGYPGGLKGDEIPVGARIVSVIDAFDAIVSTRPYRRGLPFDEAMRRLLSASGTQFDPAVVQRFICIAAAEAPSVSAAAGAASPTSPSPADLPAAGIALLRGASLRSDRGDGEAPRPPGTLHRLPHW